LDLASHCNKNGGYDRNYSLPLPTEEVRFTQHPEAAPAVIGQKFILECAATGVPAPMYLWFKERTPLPDHKSCKLVIEKVGKDDAGMYCCRATNDVNVVFSNWAEVKVQKPSILRNRKFEMIMVS